MELIIYCLILLAGVYMGYKMGRQEELKLPQLNKYLPVIKTEKEKADMIERAKHGRK